ncbi:MAG: DDE-type integrase/transposase/recombinase [Polyangiaceae bacterium]
MKAKKITASARQELIQVLHNRYRAGTRNEKSRILSEFVAVSGYHRKHAIRVLGGAENSVEPAVRATRPRLYDEAVLQTLIVLWEASDRVCGKRLRPLLPVLISALERHGHLKLDAALREKVLAMSAATMDRLLRRAKAATTGRKRVQSKPALRAQIPVRTFADWKDPLPGNMEIDLVAHGGPSAAGSFVYTLVLTDIASGWTECVPLVVREATLVVEAIERLRSAMPFALLSLDTDNGSEFMNETMLRFCVNNGIELTRSRPYRKNDQAWVEQKNGAIVRRTVGYHRLEGLAAAEALARLYAALRLFVNFFQPSFKLASKTRSGARVAKRYHPPQTPCARLLSSVAVRADVKTRLSEIAEQLDPLRLLDEIRTMQHHLVTLASGATPRLAPRRDEDLERFLGGLSTAWRAGEVRPTHTPAPKAKRNWRTRKDPFEAVWPTILQWLDVAPDQTALMLLDRLHDEHLGEFPEPLLRTLQRRLKGWRADAARRLVFGTEFHQGADTSLETPGAISRDSCGSSHS